MLVSRRKDRFEKSVSAFSLRPIERRLAASRERLDAVWRLAGSYSFQSTLARGFALVRGTDGRPVKRRAEVGAGQALELQFADGSVSVREMSGASAAQKPRPKPPEGGQGDLF